jgi:hypothetical protein
MKDLIFENEKAIKVPNILQCYDCGELATIYHPSPFLELLEFTLESASDYSLPEVFIK